MPGQPDWQRYQTSAGPLILNTGNNNNVSLDFTYMGSWRSYFLSITPVDPNALWDMFIDWYETADFSQPVTRETITIGNNKLYQRQRPVLARYFRITTLVEIPGSNNQLTVWLAPSLLDIFPGYQLNNSLLFEGINQTVGAGATLACQLNITRGGLMKMVVFQTSAQFRYNIRYFRTDGTLGYLAVVGFSTINVVNEFIFVAPETPITIEAVNLDGAASHLLHIFAYQYS